MLPCHSLQVSFKLLSIWDSRAKTICKKPSFWNDKLTEKIFKTILQNMSGVSQQCFLRIIFLILSANQVLQKKKVLKHQGTDHELFLMP